MSLRGDMFVSAVEPRNLSLPNMTRREIDDELPHKCINDAQLALLFSERAEKYTDAKVTCKGVEWKVQQSILCTRCPFFEVCFRAGTFQEGEKKTVDFKDDEPHAVEALLIYLYTLEYPNRKSDKFEQPPLDVMVLPSALVGDRNSDYKKQRHVPDSGPGEKPAPNSARFKLKSQAPKEVWQEQLGLYRIAHRLDLERLWKTSLAILTKEVDSALQSINVTQFIREVYSLGQDEAQSLRGEVATKTVEQDTFFLTKLTLDAITLSLPAFGCDLIEAMKKKDVNRTETIHALQLLNDKREEEIADYKQGIKLSQHQEMVAAHKAELREQWTKTREVKAKATELRKELVERKRAITEQKAETAKQKKEIAQQKKEIAQLKNHMAQQGSGASGQPYPPLLPLSLGSISNQTG